MVAVLATPIAVHARLAKTKNALLNAVTLLLVALNVTLAPIVAIPFLALAQSTPTALLATAAKTMALVAVPKRAH